MTWIPFICGARINFTFEVINNQHLRYKLSAIQTGDHACKPEIIQGLISNPGTFSETLRMVREIQGTVPGNRSPHSS